MVSINFNLPSMTAQRNMGATQNAFHTAVERLSSGLRINSAADDASGLSLSETLTGQVRGLQQATKNAQDGASLIQTAEGALGVVSDMLQRMRELSVQSANGVYSATDRGLIADEMKQLTAEITRVSKTTNFNGLGLLDGKMGGAQVFLGGDVGTIDQDGQGATASSTNYSAKTGALLTAANGIDAITAETSSAKPMTFLLFASAGSDGVTGHYDLTLRLVDYDDMAAAGAGASLTDPNTAGPDAIEVTQYNQDLSNLEGSKLLNFAKAFTVADANGNNVAESFSVNVVVNKNVDSTILLNSGDGYFQVSPNLASITGNAGAFAPATSTTPAVAASTSVLSRGLTGVQLQVGANNVAADQLVLTNMNNMSAEALGLVGDSGNTLGVTDIDGTGEAFGGILDTTYSVSENVKTAAGAQNSIDIIDRAITQVNALRSKLGATQNRLEHTITNLGVATENQAAAASRIKDADVAVEVSNMVRAQLLQQAATAVLAQSNSAPQAYLALLRG